MSAMTMEDVYSALADGIDAAGPQKETLLLARTVLLLANEISDPDRVCELIRSAGENLDGMRSNSPE